MRDTRSLLLLLVSLMLVLVSFGLLWTWGFRIYNKNDEAQTVQKAEKTDAESIANKVRDSLQKVYTATLNDLDLQLDSTLANTDSLRTELDYKLSEFYRLRNEIAIILRGRKTNTDFKVAKEKIGELQNKVQDFKDKNQEVEKENKKLADVLTQLGGPENVKRPPASNQKAEKTNPDPVYAVFTAADLKLRALNINNDSESETAQADKADKFTGSFTVMNYNSQLTNAEIVVVVMQPDGRVLQSSGWDSGTFNTPDGKKVYSYKFNFKYTRGEAKRLLFSLKTNKLLAGNYSMEVYYNGQVIGKVLKTLS
ncbi:MAG: hypothetical protein WBP16_03910 [Ferruginibacter sp.]